MDLPADSRAAELFVYRQQILDSLDNADDNDDGLLRFELAARMACQGDGQARSAMYRAYPRGTKRAEQMGNCFLWIDGLNGFLHVAQKIGALLRDGSNVSIAFMLWAAKKCLGEEVL